MFIFIYGLQVRPLTLGIIGRRRGEFTTSWRTFNDDKVTVDDEPCRVIYADKHPHPIRATYIRHDMRAEAARGVTRGELELAMQSC